MFLKLSKGSRVRNILVFSLSNIGDVILTAPVIDICLADYPQSVIHVIVGPKAKTLFEHHPRIRTIVYDKRMSFFGLMSWFFSLRCMPFDVLVDLRQTILGVFLPIARQTSLGKVPAAGHMRFKHLKKLQTVYPEARFTESRQAIIPRPVEGVVITKRSVVIAPGAADSKKRWHVQGFQEVARSLQEQGFDLIFVGDERDAVIVDEIKTALPKEVISLAGTIDLRQLAWVVGQAVFAITHDSAVMHMAGYCRVPAVVLWGPTDQGKYGPWSQGSQIVFKGSDILTIKAKDVLDAVAAIS